MYDAMEFWLGLGDALEYSDASFPITDEQIDRFESEYISTSEEQEFIEKELGPAMERILKSPIREDLSSGLHLVMSNLTNFLTGEPSE